MSYNPRLAEQIWIKQNFVHTVTFKWQRRQRHARQCPGFVELGRMFKSSVARVWLSGKVVGDHHVTVGFKTLSDAQRFVVQYPTAILKSPALMEPCD